MGSSKLESMPAFRKVHVFTDDHGDLLYHNFDTSVDPPEFPDGTKSCAAVSATSHWQVSQCEEQHDVVCQSGRQLFAYYYCDRYYYPFSRFINQAIIQTGQILAARNTFSCCVPCWNINLI